MKFILFVGLFVFAILANSYAADEHENHEDHDGKLFSIIYGISEENLDRFFEEFPLADIFF